MVGRDCRFDFAEAFSRRDRQVLGRPRVKTGSPTHRDREVSPTRDKSRFCLHFAEKSVIL